MNKQQYLQENIIENITPLVNELLYFAGKKGQIYEKYLEELDRIVAETSVKSLKNTLNEYALTHGDMKKLYKEKLEKETKIYEYIIVSKELAENLQHQKEIVIKYWNLWIWCRQTTGLSLEEDELLNPPNENN